MIVKVYATLRLKIAKAQIDVKAGPGDTVRDAIREVLEQHPALTPEIMSNERELVNHVHVFLNGRNIRLLDGLDTVIQEGQKLDIFPPVGGGQQRPFQEPFRFHLARKLWYNVDQERAMEICEQHRDGILILQLNAQIDSRTGPELGNKLDAAIHAGNIHLVLDLGDVPYISSAGLRVLSIALKSVRNPQVGGNLCLTNLSQTVEHAFRISGFNQVFNIYDTVSEAIVAISASKTMDADC